MAFAPPFLAAPFLAAFFFGLLFFAAFLAVLFTAPALFRAGLDFFAGLAVFFAGFLEVSCFG